MPRTGKLAALALLEIRGLLDEGLRLRRIDDSSRVNESSHAMDARKRKK